MIRYAFSFAQKTLNERGMPMEQFPNGMSAGHCASETAHVLLSASVLPPSTRREIAVVLSRQADRMVENYNDPDAGDFMKAVSNLLLRIEDIENRRNHDRVHGPEATAHREALYAAHGAGWERDPGDLAV